MKGFVLIVIVTTGHVWLLGRSRDAECPVVLGRVACNKSCLTQKAESVLSEDLEKEQASTGLGGEAEASGERTLS